ncbi:hypothetical protein [Romboutsia timonensis]|uniref:hypothetical protein n=1 Tax=Romboutsia timonensis TaxID=1776391 RepID=UPI0012B5823B|nr:hypothetical protein [Romboutsia timonensis]
MIKDQLIKARCTVEQKQYIEKFMYKNKCRSLLEAIRAIINNHMIFNPMLPAGGAKDGE